MTKLTTAAVPPIDTYLAMQQEAAEKFFGEPKESLYAVMLKPWFEPSVVYRFRRTDFSPMPNVDVVMMRMRKRGPPLIERADAQLFRDFVVYAFTTRQPTLRDTFKGIFSSKQFRRLSKHIGFDPAATPTLLTFDQWLQMFNYFKSASNVQTRQLIAGSERHLRKQQARLQKMHRTRTLSSVY